MSLLKDSRTEPRREFCSLTRHISILEEFTKLREVRSQLSSQNEPVTPYEAPSTTLRALIGIRNVKTKYDKTSKTFVTDDADMAAEARRAVASSDL